MPTKQKTGALLLVLALILAITGFVVGNYQYKHTFSGQYVEEMEGKVSYDSERREAFLIGGLFFWIPALAVGTAGFLIRRSSAEKAELDSEH